MTILDGMISNSHLLTHYDFQPLSEVKAKLSERLKTLEDQGKHLVITTNGRPSAVIIPYALYLKLLESRQEASPREIEFDRWRLDLPHRQQTTKTFLSLFDLDSLSKKGKSSYKEKALRDFQK